MVLRMVSTTKGVLATASYEEALPKRSGTLWKHDHPPLYSAAGSRNIGGTQGGWMKYSTPELRFLGSLAGLTLGQGGSCPDGAGQNDTNLGGMSNCGISGMN